ncbi:MAG: ChaN family lipoprotein [Betaproteobacteria bacterium]|nr:ChaN family lipoprotein [Betaproteobacteria bacterium]
MLHAPGRLLSRLPVFLGACLLAACSTLPRSDHDRAIMEGMAAADIVLLGEFHDNAAQHRLRLQWLRELADRAPITIVLEHLDADAQPRLDEARHMQDTRLPVSTRARQLAESAGFRFDGWDWTLIGPVVELALERNLPIQAANLSSSEAFAIARGQPHALGSAVPTGWTPEVEQRMARVIRDGHCGLLPEVMIPAMVRAQRARDARIAEVVIEVRAGGRRPVLLAGNGHVRTDLGVPLHLRDTAGSARIFAVGLLEAPVSPDEGRFDAVRITEAQERPDPCESLRKRFGAAK